MLTSRKQCGNTMSTNVKLIKENYMNKNTKKALALRNKESYIQAVNARFEFKSKDTYIFTSPYVEGTGTSHNCITKKVKSYKLKVSGGNNFWVIETLDGKTLVQCEVELTNNYYYRARKAKAKAGDFCVPHLCYGYWDCFPDKIKAIEEKDLAEMEAEGYTDRFYRWLKDRNALLEATFN